MKIVITEESSTRADQLEEGDTFCLCPSDAAGSAEYLPIIFTLTEKPDEGPLTIQGDDGSEEIANFSRISQIFKVVSVQE